MDRGHFPAGRLGALRKRTFRSLVVRNFRLFFLGQLVSASGFWMHQIAQVWLVLELTGSGVAVGVTAGLSHLPLVMVGSWAGLVADRVDKRRLLLVTQTSMAVFALGLALVVVADIVELWMIYTVAALFGCANAFDNPTRRSFIVEMVDRAHVSNAISLYSTVMATARAAGPAIGGIVIGQAGLAPAFFVNAASYGAIIFALAVMDPTALHRAPRLDRARGQIREGLRYARRTPMVGLPLLMALVIGTFAYNFQVVVPLIVERVFEGDAATFGFTMALVSGGSVVGSLYTASRRGVDHAYLASIATVFGVAIILASTASTLPLFAALLVLVGSSGASFIASGGSVLQEHCDPRFHGRMSALFSIAFLGSYTVGGPLTGWLADLAGARMAFAVGGVVTAGTGLVVWPRARRLVREVGAEAGETLWAREAPPEPAA